MEETFDEDEDDEEEEVGHSSEVVDDFTSVMA